MDQTTQINLVVNEDAILDWRKLVEVFLLENLCPFLVETGYIKARLNVTFYSLLLWVKFFKRVKVEIDRDDGLWKSDKKV